MFSFFVENRENAERGENDQFVIKILIVITDALVISTLRSFLIFDLK